MDAFDRGALAVSRQANQRALAALDLVDDTARPKWLRNYSLRRAIRASAAEINSFERELSKDLERTTPLVTGGNSFIAPWEIFTEAHQHLTRADIVGSTTAGGYLTYTENIPCADALRPLMLVGGLGATFVDSPGPNIALPKQTGAATANWLSAETSTATESDQVFGQVAFAPHTVSGYTEFSRLSVLQSAPSSVEFVVRRDLLAIVARALDLAAISGQGTAGQPQGLVGMTGVGTWSGTTASLATVVAATAVLSNALNESTGVAASLAAASILKQRTETSYSTRTLWEGSLINGTCTGLPGRSSTALTGALAVIGSWNYLNVCVWGGGVEIAVNPYATGNFQAGIVGMRALLTADVAPTWPSAFNVATTIT